MAKYAETGLESIKSGPHRDYDINLKIAQNFANKVANSLLPGMLVEIRNGEHIKKALLMISWKPPIKAKLGTFATPISLHDSTSSVNKKIEYIFNCYFGFAKDYFNKQQLNLFEKKAD